MKRNKLIFWLSLILVLAMAVGSGCAAKTQDTESGPFKGMQAPDFTLKDLSGTEWTLSELKGNSVALVFFTSW